MLHFDFDSDTEIMYMLCMSDPQNQSEGSLCDSGVHEFTTSGTGLVATDCFGGGNAVRFPASSNGLLDLGLRGTCLDKVTSHFWTIDCLYRVTALNGSGTRIIDIRSGGTVVLIAKVNADGTVSAEFIPSGGDYFGQTVTPYFPKANYQHIRFTVDYTNAEVKVYAGDAGTMPALILTVPTDTTAPAGTVSRCFLDTDGNQFDIGRLRFSRIIRTDSFPTQAAIPPTGISAVSANNTVTVTISNTPILTGNSANAQNWIINSATGYPINVNSLSIVGNTILLNTTNQTNSATYNITIPNGIIDINGLNYTTPATLSFTGSGVSPTLLYDTVVDANTIEVAYSDKMDLSTASNPANYSINNGLSVTGVSAFSDRIFTISTSRQVTGTVYTITINVGAGGITSIYGNKVT